MFPEVWIDDREGDPEFVNLVETAVSSTEYSEFDPLIQAAFKCHHNGEDGCGLIRKVMAEIRRHRELRIEEKNAVLIFILSYGQAVFNKMPEHERTKYFPVNDFRTHYIQQKIIVEVRSLVSVTTKRDEIYHSRHERTIEVDGQPLIVAFRRHLIDALAMRFCPRYLQNYGAMGDMFAWLDESDYFEVVTLPKGNKAFSIFEMCGVPGFVQHRYFKKLLPAATLTDVRCAVYRAGYCPIEQVGKYAMGRTFLVPGFTKTPEYALLEKATLPHDKKEEMKKIATADPPPDAVPPNEYMDVVKYFHDNGIPQAMILAKPYFNTLHRPDLAIRRIK